MSLPTLPTLLQTPIQTLLPPPPQKPNPTLAMQILNATAKYTTPTLEIYKAAQHAIQHLYKQIGTNTQIEKLQIVKAHVNLCARMVEDGMHQESRAYLEDLHNVLNEVEVPSVDKEAKGPRRKSRASTTKLPVVKLANPKTTTADQLLQVPHDNKNIDKTLINVVICYLINMLKILIMLEDNEVLLDCIERISQDYGLRWWIERLTTIDKEAAHKHYEACYRSLVKAISHRKDSLRPGNFINLQLKAVRFYMGDQAFDLTTCIDLSKRVGAQYEAMIQSDKLNGFPHLIRFYTAIMEDIGNFVGSIHQKMKYFGLCDCMVLLGKKLKDYTIIEKAYSMMYVQFETESDALKSTAQETQILITRIYISIGYLALKMLNDSSDGSSLSVQCRTLRNHLTEFEKRMTARGMEENLSLGLRSIDFLRKAVSKYIEEDVQHTSAETPSEILVDAARVLYDVVTLMIQSGSSKLEPYIANLVDAHNNCIRVAHRRESNIRKCLEIATSGSEFAKRHNCLEGLEWISNTMCSIGLSAYATKEIQLSILCLEQSISYLELCLPKGAFSPKHEHCCSRAQHLAKCYADVRNIEKERYSLRRAFAYRLNAADEVLKDAALSTIVSKYVETFSTSQYVSICAIQPSCFLPMDDKEYQILLSLGLLNEAYSLVNLRLEDAELRKTALPYFYTSLEQIRLSAAVGRGHSMLERSALVKRLQVHLNNMETSFELGRLLEGCLRLVTLVLSYEAGDIKVLDEILALIESGFATDSQIDDTYLLRVLVDNLQRLISFLHCDHRFVEANRCLKLLESINASFTPSSGGDGKTASSESTITFLKAPLGIMLIRCAMIYNYIFLGYTTQAGGLIQSCKATLLSRSSLSAQLDLALVYCRYLIRISDFEKSDEVLQQSKSMYTNLLTNKREKRSSLIRLAIAHDIKAQICHHTGKIALALEHSHMSLQIHQCVHSNLKPIMSPENRLTNRLSGMKLESDAKATEPMKRNEWSDCIEDSLVRADWQSLSLLLDNLEQLSQLYIVQGSYKQAEYYISLGHTTARTIGCTKRLHCFEQLKAEIYYRTGRLEDSQQTIKHLEEDQSTLSYHDTGSITLKIHQAELQLRLGELDVALDWLSDVEGMLQNWLSPKAIKALESIGLTSEITAGSAYLSQMKGKVMIYIAKLLATSGKLSESERMLTGNVGARKSSAVQIQAEYHLSYGLVKLSQARKHIHNMAQFSEMDLRTWIAPSMCPLKIDPARKPKTFAVISNCLVVAVEHFENARVLASGGSLPQVFYQACNLLQDCLILRSTISDTSFPGWILWAIEDTNRSLTLKREICSSLRIKSSSKQSGGSRWPSKAKSPTKADMDVSDDVTPVSVSAKQTVSTVDESFDMTSIFADNFTSDIETKAAEAVAHIPARWVVCTMSFDIKTNHLMLTRATKEATPITIRVPLNRHASSETTDLSFLKIMGELRNIITRNDETLGPQNVKDPNTYRKQWWAKRQSIDTQLQDLITRVERVWFGIFRGMLSLKSTETSKGHDLLRESYEAITKIIPTFSANEDHAFGSIFAAIQNITTADIEEFLELNLGHQYEISPADRRKLTRTLLKIFDKHQVKYEDSREQQSHLILVLDKHSHQFPWESLPVLRNSSVSRLPSIAFLSSYLEKQQLQMLNISGTKTGVTVKSNRTFYILNPSNDLSHTQHEFQDWLQSQPHWEGIIGKSPAEGSLKKIEKSELFLYFGHGGGEKYFRSQSIRDLNPAPVSLLLGCSSGQLLDGGEFDPTGTVLNYLAAGSTTILANLWDVTDKDIDRLSVTLFEEWGLGQIHHKHDLSLSEALTRARNACVMKYLVGCAPVIYGVPVYLQE